VVSTNQADVGGDQSVVPNFDSIVSLDVAPRGKAWCGVDSHTNSFRALDYRGKMHRPIDVAMPAKFLDDNALKCKGSAVALHSSNVTKDEQVMLDLARISAKFAVSHSQSSNKYCAYSDSARKG
jgi:hypothetical protein